MRSSKLLTIFTGRMEVVAALVGTASSAVKSLRRASHPSSTPGGSGPSPGARRPKEVKEWSAWGSRRATANDRAWVDAASGRLVGVFSPAASRQAVQPRASRPYKAFLVSMRFPPPSSLLGHGPYSLAPRASRLEWSPPRTWGDRIPGQPELARQPTALPSASSTARRVAGTLEAPQRRISRPARSEGMTTTAIA